MDNSSIEDVPLMISDCIKRSNKLSEWELNFIKSINLHYDEKGSIKDKQFEELVKKLEVIWERATK